MVLFVVLRNRKIHLRPIQPSEPYGSLHNVCDFFVNGGSLHTAVLNRRHQRLGIHVVANRHLKVEASVGGAHSVVGRNPIRHDDAIESPLGAGNLVIQVAVLRHVEAVHQVVPVHDRTDVALLYRRFESRQVDFAQRAFINDRIGVMTIEFRVVPGEMLDGRAYALFLHPSDEADNDLRGKKWILSEVFEIAAIHGGAINIDSGGEQEMDAASFGISCDASAHPLRQRRVPRRG